ncbi:hypothetical protein D9M71_513170 [compost metagenome]
MLHLRGQREGGVQRGTRRAELVHQTDALSFLGFDDLAEHQHLPRPADTDARRQGVQLAEVGEQADLAEAGGEARRAAAHQAVAGQRHRQPGAHRPAFDGGDDRLAHAQHLADQVGVLLHAHAAGVEVGDVHVAEVAASAEDFCRTGEDHAAHDGIGVRFAQRFEQLGTQCRGQCVASRRIVEAQETHRTEGFLQKHLAHHATSACNRAM